MSDRLLQFLLLLLAIIIAVWALGYIYYPFGLLVLISAILARTFHLVGQSSDKANLSGTR